MNCDVIGDIHGHADELEALRVTPLLPFDSPEGRATADCFIDVVVEPRNSR